MDRKEILKKTEHAVLAQDTMLRDVVRDCRRAIDYKMPAIIVPPRYCKDAKSNTRTDISLGTVIGFPFGYDTAAAKCAAIELLKEEGVEEFDVVLNIGQIKMEMFAIVCMEMEKLRKAVGNRGVLKVILETGYLTEEQIGKTCIEAVRNRVDFVKTCTGFGPRGATLDDIRIMKEYCAGNCQIKAAGGIRTFEEAEKFLEAGADRIGASALLTEMYDEEHPRLS